MRYVLSGLLLALCCAPLWGCGGATEKEKKAAEAAPDLDIGEPTDEPTDMNAKPEPKSEGEAEPTKP